MNGNTGGLVQSPQPSGGRSKIAYFSDGAGTAHVAPPSPPSASLPVGGQLWSWSLQRTPVHGDRRHPGEHVAEVHRLQQLDPLRQTAVGGLCTTKRQKGPRARVPPPAPPLPRRTPHWKRVLLTRYTVTWYKRKDMVYSSENQGATYATEAAMPQSVSLTKYEHRAQA